MYSLNLFEDVTRGFQQPSGAVPSETVPTVPTLEGGATVPVSQPTCRARVTSSSHYLFLFFTLLMSYFMEFKPLCVNLPCQTDTLLTYPGWFI